jgi:hypothetical protein
MSLKVATRADRAQLPSGPSWAIMPSTMESRTIHPVPPGNIPLEGGWLVLPFAAALGGAWVFLPSPLSGSLTSLAVALALVVGGWQAFWLTFTRTDWHTPLTQWQDWHTTTPLPRWPYMQQDTPGAALHHRLSQAYAWWLNAGRPTLARPLTRGAVALLVTLLLGAALGRQALLLSLCFLTITELALLWHEGKGEINPLWEAVALIGLPWMLGATLVESEVLRPIVSGLALALTIGIFAQPSWWTLFGPALGAAYLIWQGQGAAAGWLLLLALPGFLILTHHPNAADRHQALGPWVIGMVILVAGVL